MAKYQGLTEDVMEGLASASRHLNSDAAYAFYFEQIKDRFLDSDITDTDQKNFFTDSVWLIIGVLARDAAAEKESLKHLPKIISGSRHVIKGLTDTVYDDMKHPINHKHEAIIHDWWNNVKREFLRDLKTLDKHYVAISDVLEHHCIKSVFNG